MTSDESLRSQREALGLSQAKLAELTGISQHLLSSHELGKSTLDGNYLLRVQEALADSSAVAKFANRPKRYTKHSFKGPISCETRRILHERTLGNRDYLKDLRNLAYLKENSEKNLNAVSLFSGCGGFSYGISSAGFNLRGFVEINQDLADIYRKNFPDSIEIGSDISSVSDSVLDNFKNQFGSIDIFVGGPPCQGFSLAGKRNQKDPRNSLFQHYLRFVHSLQPKFAILENVRVLTSMKNGYGGLVKDDITKAFNDYGYVVKKYEINAKDFGIPQHRERVLFIACRNDLNVSPTIPDRSFDGKDDLFNDSGNTSHRKFSDACSDLEYLESGDSGSDPLHEAVCHPDHVIRWLWDVPQGRSAHENEDEALRPPSGYNTTYKRQVWDEPASTVQTTFGMISGCRNVHPIATRSLTIREAARIQSFPDNFNFIGKKGTIRTAIGNAVPPLLAYKLGIHFRSKIN